jgi:hypothetical protein
MTEPDPIDYGAYSTPDPSASLTTDILERVGREAAAVPPRARPRVAIIAAVVVAAAAAAVLVWRAQLDDHPAPSAEREREQVEVPAPAQPVPIRPTDLIVPVPTGPTHRLPPAGSSAEALTNEARAAAKTGEWGRALRLVDQALALDPTSQDALMVGILAACNLHNADRARDYHDRISSPARRGMGRQSCLKNGVEIP